MSDFLDRAAQDSARRASEARRRCPPAELEALIPTTRAVDFHAPPFAVIAELKRVSPAEGPLADEIGSASHRARCYERGGAAALSVLTEPHQFGGSLDDLAAVAEATTAPVMRKDFIVDPYQLVEARSRGAVGALVIVRVAAHAHHAMIDTAAAHLRFLLFEAFDRADFDIALRLAERAQAHGVTPLIGVNCRDLRTLAVQPDRFASFAEAIPAEWPVIAESGIHTAEDARGVAEMGYRGVLVGTALMRTADPTALVHGMVAAGHHVRSETA